MKRFQITVNGKAYDVAVEEVAGTAPVAAPAPAPVAAPVPAAPAPAPAPAAAPAPAPAAPVNAEGTKVSAPMPGNILDVRVNQGQAVKSGDVLVILEAMKMENEILAPCDGTIAALPVKKGDTVNSNDLIAVIA